MEEETDPFAEIGTDNVTSSNGTSNEEYITGDIPFPEEKNPVWSPNSRLAGSAEYPCVWVNDNKVATPGSVKVVDLDRIKKQPLIMDGPLSQRLAVEGLMSLSEDTAHLKTQVSSVAEKAAKESSDRNKRIQNSFRGNYQLKTLYKMLTNSTECQSESNPPPYEVSTLILLVLISAPKDLLDTHCISICISRLFPYFKKLNPTDRMASIRRSLEENKHYFLEVPAEHSNGTCWGLNLSVSEAIQILKAEKARLKILSARANNEKTTNGKQIINGGHHKKLIKTFPLQKVSPAKKPQTSKEPEELNDEAWDRIWSDPHFLEPSPSDTPLELKCKKLMTSAISGRGPSDFPLLVLITMAIALSPKGYLSKKAIHKFMGRFFPGRKISPRKDSWLINSTLDVDHFIQLGKRGTHWTVTAKASKRVLEFGDFEKESSSTTSPDNAAHARKRKISDGSSSADASMKDVTSVKAQDEALGTDLIPMKKIKLEAPSYSETHAKQGEIPVITLEDEQFNTDEHSEAPAQESSSDILTDIAVGARKQKISEVTSAADALIKGGIPVKTLVDGINTSDRSEVPAQEQTSEALLQHIIAAITSKPKGYITYGEIYSSVVDLADTRENGLDARLKEAMAENMSMFIRMPHGVENSGFEDGYWLLHPLAVAKYLQKPGDNDSSRLKLINGNLLPKKSPELLPTSENESEKSLSTCDTEVEKSLTVSEDESRKSLSTCENEFEESLSNCENEFEKSLPSSEIESEKSLQIVSSKSLSGISAEDFSTRTSDDKSTFGLHGDLCTFTENNDGELANRDESVVSVQSNLIEIDPSARAEVLSNTEKASLTLSRTNGQIRTAAAYLPSGCTDNDTQLLYLAVYRFAATGVLEISDTIVAGSESLQLKDDFLKPGRIESDKSPLRVQIQDDSANKVAESDKLLSKPDDFLKPDSIDKEKSKSCSEILCSSIPLFDVIQDDTPVSSIGTQPGSTDDADNKSSPSLNGPNTLSYVQKASELSETMLKNCSIKLIRSSYIEQLCVKGTKEIEPEVVAHKRAESKEAVDDAEPEGFIGFASVSAASLKYLDALNNVMLHRLPTELTVVLEQLPAEVVTNSDASDKQDEEIAIGHHVSLETIKDGFLGFDTNHFDPFWKGWDTVSTKKYERFRKLVQLKDNRRSLMRVLSQTANAVAAYLKGIENHETVEVSPDDNANESILQSTWFQEQLQAVVQAASPTVQEPHYSYPVLAALALCSTITLPLSHAEIVSFIEQTFPYYRHTGVAWRGPLRRTLELNDLFVRSCRPSVCHRKETDHGGCWALREPALAAYIITAQVKTSSSNNTQSNQGNKINDLVCSNVLIASTVDNKQDARKRKLNRNKLKEWNRAKNSLRKMDKQKKENIFGKISDSSDKSTDINTAVIPLPVISHIENPAFSRSSDSSGIGKDSVSNTSSGHSTESMRGKSLSVRTLYTCDSCSSEFECLFVARYHKCSLSTVDHFPCYLCHQLCADGPALTGHMNTKHPAEYNIHTLGSQCKQREEGDSSSASVKTDEPVKGWPCECCEPPLRFGTTLDLTTHIYNKLSKNAFPSFKCQACSACFYTELSLQKHASHCNG